MKTMTFNSMLKTVLILTVLCSFTMASAQDFWDNSIKYTITSDSTVKVSGQCYWYETDNYFDHESSYNYNYNIIIPNHITFNNTDYTVTEIGDWAFYCYAYEDTDGGYITLDYDITIPETVTSIGLKAFGGDFNMVNVFCLAKTPPMMNKIIDDQHGVINLFVSADAYMLYQENNNQNHYFDSIYITDGESSRPPEYKEEFLYQPIDGPYGCAVKIYPRENSVIYLKKIINDTGMWDHVATYNWVKIENRDSIYYFYEALCDDLSANANGWGIEFFSIENGKSPSHTIFCGDVKKFTPNNRMSCFSYKWWTKVVYRSSDLGFGFDWNGFGVVQSIYINHCLFNETEILYCSGDVVIPETVTYHDYCNDTDYTFDVTFIDVNAFMDCIDLTSIDIPYSIDFIGEGAFSGCTSLTKVNLTDLAAWCQINFEGSDSNPIKYAHHFYLDNSEVTDLIIPNTISKINWSAFEGCYGLTSVTLPSSVTNIEPDAFIDCPNISHVKCLGITPANIEGWGILFDECVYQNATLYVPIVAVEAYKNAEGWKRFQHIVGFYNYDFEADGVFYQMSSDGEVFVTRDEYGYQGIVTIPSSVTYEGVTYSVTGISSGAFAGATLQSLILPVTISNINEGAFTDCHINSLIITGNGSWTAGAIPCTIDNLYVMSTVTGIGGLQVNPTTIYSYSTVPPTCNDNTFTDYDGELHVPASSLAAYFTAPYWSNFINIVGDAVEPTSIKLNRDSVEVLVGNQLSLNSTITPANATPRDLIWTTSDGDIATVTDGVITAVKAGECDIKAYLLDKTAICHVTVTEILPTEITLNQDFAKLEIGSQLTLTATVLPEEATDKFVTWSTTNSNVATVDSLGVVTAVGEGECFITASCRDKQATCHIIVVDHFIYITLDEHNVRLLPNHMFTLTPTVSPANTSLVVTSSDPTVAAARMANGKIQLVGIKEGSTVIMVNSADGYAEADSCLVKVYTLRGDVNCDGFVNINDVTTLINYLLSGNDEGIDLINADTNNDGKTNIGDVTRLINSLLSGEPLPPKDEPIEGNLTFNVNGVTFTMVPVEGGTFTMGATPEQGDDALDGEKPAHQVTLSDYAIGQTEVTQALWVAVMGTNPSRFKDRLENPVELVDWNDCQAFITQLNQLTGKQFRLPTEAEWEYAARGGNKSQGYKYAGSNDIDEVAWYDENSNSTQPVGTKKANELGIYDMSGNVWEWCQDYYGNYSAEPQTNPTGPATGTDRIRRGVGWNGSQSNGRVSHRSSRAETYKYNSLGLRLAL